MRRIGGRRAVLEDLHESSLLLAKDLVVCTSLGKTLLRVQKRVLEDSRVGRYGGLQSGLGIDDISHGRRIVRGRAGGGRVRSGDRGGVLCSGVLGLGASWNPGRLSGGSKGRVASVSA